MKISKTQYLVVGVVILFAFLVIVLITIGKNDSEEVLPPFQSEGLASLPPVGENFEQTAQIELETGNKYDFGIIPNDKETTKKVKVYNKGKGPLNLRFIQTSCACTQGTIPPGQEVIPPGGEGYILVTVYPSKVAGFYSEKVLTIYSNDPKNSPFELKVIARINPEFLIEPEDINFGELPKGSTKEISVTITQQNMPKPLEIYKIYESGVPDYIQNNITATLKKVEGKEPIQYLLTFKIEPFIAPVEMNRTFFISTNIDRYPEVPIKIKGKIIAPYKLNVNFPQPITLISSSKETSKELIIEPTEENEHIEIVSYEVEPNIFSATPHTEDGKVIFNITTQHTPNETYGILKINLTIKGQPYEERALLKNPGKLKNQ